MALKRTILFLVALWIFGAQASMAASLEEVDRLHENAVSAEDFARIVSLLEEAPAAAGERAWRLARAHYRLGKLSAGKGGHYARCIESAKEAVLLNSGLAAGYFYKGLCLGRMGELEGLWKSLEIIDPFRKDMETALKLDPGFDHGGPHRALAKLYLELPFFLGGDLGKSLDHIGRAVSLAPQYEENYLIKAEVLFARGRLNEALEALAALRDVAGDKPPQPDQGEVLRRAGELQKKIMDRKSARDSDA